MVVPNEYPVTAFAVPPTVTAKSLLSGAPVTTSLIVRSTSFEPPFAVAVLIVGGTPSIFRSAVDARDPEEPALGSVVTMLLLSSSTIVPLFNVNGLELL